ncbi:MAG: NADH-quinone oxidoreductase subunit B family protein [Candidatus Kariarchaeaceae archaeon]|jgi:F420-non-reducing hydrogenase small subunit
MSEKPKVAFYWLASCGGCEEAVVDLAEAILDVVAAVDIVFWPVALDFKKSDVEAMDDGSIAVTFINGSVRTSEQEEMSEMLRRKSGLVIAFGACSHMGGIPGLANFHNKDEIFADYYLNSPSVTNPEKIVPQTSYKDNGYTLTLPVFLDTVKTLDQVVAVDYYLPGCPPTPELIGGAVNAILTGQLPPAGSVLSPNINLCEGCPLEKKDEQISIKEFKRVHKIAPDPTQCLLEQGIVCMGPVTRSGCTHLCMNALMPCRGCFGPTDEVSDVGAKFISALASIVESNNPKEFNETLKTIPSYTKLFYMFSMAASTLGRKNMEIEKNV